MHAEEKKVCFRLKLKLMCSLISFLVNGFKGMEIKDSHIFPSFVQVLLFSLAIIRICINILNGWVDGWMVGGQLVMHIGCEYSSSRRVVVAPWDVGWLTMSACI